MRFFAFSIFVLLSSLSVAGQSPAPASPDVRQLSWLIGEWEFEDTSTKAAGYDYTETGTRTCAYALDDKYIRCESRGTSKGKTRTYVFYLNYNHVDKRFEMLSMHGNWPRKSLFVGNVSTDGRTIDLLLSEPYEEDGEKRRSWARIVYDGKDSYIWESGSRKESDSKPGPVRFRDVVGRVNTSK